MAAVAAAAKMESLICHSLKTFKKRLNNTPELFNSDLNYLKSIINNVSLNDLKLPKWLLGKEMRKDVARYSPVEYMELYKSIEVTIGVFILKEGASLPLHDHPGMFGFLKVVQGSLKIKSYSVVDVQEGLNRKSEFYYSGNVTAKAHPDIIVAEKDDCCMLTPDERNIHEVECVAGTTAFLDVLSPPYDNGSSADARTCHYFNIVELLPNNLVKLVQVSDPDNY